jgi:hypothetical protein
LINIQHKLVTYTLTLIAVFENALVAVASRCWASANACSLSFWTARLGLAGEAEVNAAAARRRIDKGAIMMMSLKREKTEDLRYWKESVECSAFAERT